MSLPAHLCVTSVAVVPYKDLNVNITDAGLLDIGQESAAAIHTEKLLQQNFRNCSPSKVTNMSATKDTFDQSILAINTCFQCYGKALTGEA